MFDQSCQQMVDLSLIANIEAREGRTVRGDADGQKAAVVTEGKNVFVGDIIADINRSSYSRFLGALVRGRCPYLALRWGQC